MASNFVSSQSTSHFRKILVVIKQTAFEEYSQLRLRGKAPKALRWPRLESRYKAHKACVNNLTGILRHHNIEFSCVNRVELDRQHLANVDMVMAVGGDGTCLSAAHFLDHGTIPLLGVNSDPIKESDRDTKKKTDERRSHGALCMCTADNMSDQIAKVLYGGGIIQERARIQCTVKSTFSETRLVPALNDVLIANPSPAAVSRFRMGFAEEVDVDMSNDGILPKPGSSFDERSTLQYKKYGTVTRFGGVPYDIKKSLNIWGSGIWISTATGATAAMAAAGGQPMDLSSDDIQYYIREHIYEHGEQKSKDIDNGFVATGDQLHMRWNSQKGMIFMDGDHMTHDLVLGDEILINGNAPPLQLFVHAYDDE
jgi:NAD+ kinase